MAKSKRTNASKKYPNLTDEFAAMFAVDSHMHSLEERRIRNNENCFKVWREHFGLNEYNIAEAMGMNFSEYILLEEGEIDPTDVDIVNFCRYMGIHPCQLVNDSPYDVSMIKALLMVYDDPALLSPWCKTPENMAAQIIQGEATSAYDDLVDHKRELKRFPKQYHALTIAFIDHLLENDGMLFTTQEESIFEQTENFIDNAKNELETVNARRDYYAAEYNVHNKFCNDLGLRVHRESWGEVKKKIDRSIKHGSFEDTMKKYLDVPAFIGRKNFPEFPVPILFKMINGDKKTLSRRNAQLKLVQHLETLFIAEDEKIKCEIEAAAINDCLDYFDEWRKKCWDLLDGFENRQIILQDPSFNELTKTPAPKLNGL